MALTAASISASTNAAAVVGATSPGAAATGVGGLNSYPSILLSFCTVTRALRVGVTSALRRRCLRTRAAVFASGESSRLRRREVTVTMPLQTCVTAVLHVTHSLKNSVTSFGSQWAIRARLSVVPVTLSEPSTHMVHRKSNHTARLAGDRRVTPESASQSRG